MEIEDELGRNSQLLNEDNEAINLAMSIIRMHESLKIISSKIEQYRANPKFIDCSRELYELQNIVRHTLQLNKERDTLEVIIKEKNQLFYTKLNSLYPNLTSNEVRLSTLIRLNLSSKEIASILNISLKSVEMNRYRLRKKMQIGGKQSLSDHIRSI